MVLWISAQVCKQVEHWASNNKKTLSSPLSLLFFFLPCLFKLAPVLAQRAGQEEQEEKEEGRKRNKRKKSGRVEEGGKSGIEYIDGTLEKDGGMEEKVDPSR